MSRTASRAAALLGADLVEARTLAGGNLSKVMRIVMADGGTAIAKAGATADAEAEMLRAIAAAGAPAPAVLAVGADLLVMQDLGADDGPGGAWADLGTAVRKLHTSAGANYGWHRDHAFGAVSIHNDPTPDWPSFWAERRLMPSCPEIASDLARRIERLAARLPDLLPARPAASLLHGDLWTGNVMARGGRVTGLIDPACYFGHGEVDLAMLALFGAPDAAFRLAYGDTEPGIGQRLPIYQLWPALVHLRLFGEAYRGQVERCLGAALAA